MSREPNRRPVTVEDLLRLKRAERPNAEFWADWDRQLHTKQLAAILEQRPWWRDALPRLWITLARLHLPLGATAVLGLTIFTVREYNARGTDHRVQPEAPVIGTSIVAQERNQEADVRAELRQSPRATASAPQVFANVSSSNVLAAMTDVESRGGQSESTEMTPSSRAIATNLAIAQRIESRLARSLTSRDLFDAPALANRTQIEEPLQQLALERDARADDRLGISYRASYNAEAQAGNSLYQERRISRLREDQLYEQASSRVFARANRVSLKF
ncbi:MAG: hypothetical protein HZA31_09700 [Opitutae bacterium]|nr:hypothetical protein [Opitutae bacterium]